MELEVLNKAGKSTGRKVSLPEGVFGIEPSKHAIYLDVKQYLANQRQGTHKSKEKGEITASTKKIKKQKGTGLKSPVFVGGGRIFGPKPRDYSFKLNKKLKVVARKSAFATQLIENKLLIIEDFSLDQPKTKEFTSILNSFNLDSSRVTYVVSSRDKNLYLSSRNIQKFKLISLDDVNTYDLLNCKKLILSESSVKELENRLS
jgi:large subunit ribosomal protein L4